MSLLVLAGLVIAAMLTLDNASVFTALAALDYAYLLPILLLSTGYLAFKAVRFAGLLRQLAGLPLGAVCRAYFAGQPATFVPGGIAARAGLLAQVGVPPASSAVPILYGSLFDLLLFVLATLIAALWFPAAHGTAAALLWLCAVTALLLAIPACRRGGSRLLQALLQRLGLGSHWVAFSAGVHAVNRAPVLLPALLWSCAVFIAGVLMLVLTLQALSVTASLPSVLLTYALSSIAGRLTLLPGGLGATEGGMVALLHSAGGVDLNTAAAVAAVHRIADSLFQALLGAVIYFFFWNPARERRASIVGPLERGLGEAT